MFLYYTKAPVCKSSRFGCIIRAALVGSDRSLPLSQLSPANNLPQQLTTFIGREAAISEIKRRVQAARMLTLTGTGGSGKTRLSLKVAAELLESYPDGAWFVELSTLRDSALVPQAVASVLSVREEPGEDLTHTLAERLKASRSLLILDNCEHLLSACSALASRLLRDCLDITILATSREALNIEGEDAWQVPPMSLPDPLKPLPVESLKEYEAIQLFVERALRTRDGFALTAHNGPALSKLCWQLDGLPLAIELAAARVRTLTVEQIVERLDQRFKLLTYNVYDVEPRQQTLRALIDWSYDLLTGPEKGMLRHISVFVGSFTLDAITTICGDGKDEFEVLDLLTPLAEKSLIVVEEHSGEARYRLLETIRRYALDRLNESDETEDLRGRHRDWYVQMAERAQAGLIREDSRSWLDRLELDHDNIRAALEWSTTGEPDAETALRLASAVWRFWDMRGYITEGRKWLTDALTVSGDAPSVSRARALNAAGNLALEQGDFSRAEELYGDALGLRRKMGDKVAIANSLSNLGVVARRKGEFQEAAQLNEEGLALLRELDNRDGIASVLNNLGYVVQQQGDYDRARELFVEALALFRELGDQQGIIVSLNNLGSAAQAKGDYEQARIYYEDALSRARELDDKLSVAGVTKNLGSFCTAQGDYEQAAKLYRESLTTYHEQGDKQGIIECLEGLAAALAYGHEEHASRLFGAAEAIRERIGSPHPPADRAIYERYVAQARSRLSPEVYEAARTAGRLLSVDDVFNLAQQVDLPEQEYPKRDPQHFDLTRRETEVLRLVAGGLSDIEIARKLSLSPRTVQSHLQSIYNKLEVSNRSSAGRFAVEQGLV
jgi:non-specific serine/threonine protein kinase